MSYIRLGAIVLILSGGAAQAASQAYQVYLEPVARSDATRLAAVGRGTADVTVDGNKLVINGKFGGMASAATEAHLCIGEGIGTPGTCDTKELMVSKDTSGTLSGDVTLDSRQLAALEAGQLYVQINSVGAPAPSGNLWGWLLVAHEQVGQDVPQEGHWFLPQYDMPKSVEHGSTHPLLANPNS
jgi:hypothetical protein